MKLIVTNLKEALENIKELTEERDKALALVARLKQGTAAQTITQKTRAELEAEIKRLRSQIDDGDYLASKFIGSKREEKKIRHFHRPNCEWAAYIKPPNLIEFNSHQEAVDAGYKPCKTCRS